MKYVIEQERKVPIWGEFDVIVCGGGPGGIGAAISAARNGAKVLLIERNSFLGGTATASLVPVFLIALDKVSGFAKELMVDLVADGGARAGIIFSFDPEIFKEKSLNKLLEAGVQPLFYTQVCSPIIEKERIVGVITESKSGRGVFLSNIVIDATGDGDIAASSGVPYILGREEDGKMKPVTLIFRLGNIDFNSLINYAQNNPQDFTRASCRHVINIENKLIRIIGFFSLVQKAKERGDLNNNRDCHYLRIEGVQLDRGIAFINSTRVYGIDGTNAFQLTQAEITARVQMKELLNFIKNYIPGCQNTYLIDSAPHLGVRETRHIQGQYVLSEKDISDKVKFIDSVAKIWRHHLIGHPMHSPDAGEGAPTDYIQRNLLIPARDFQVPYRCLVPQKISGLLLAGRCISVTHDADPWTRGMFSCLTFGQVAGTAAFLSCEKKVNPKEVNVEELKNLLNSQEVVIE